MSACLENFLQGDTLVYTEKGYAPICEVKVGNLVLSREEATGETGYKKVGQCHQSKRVISFNYPRWSPMCHLAVFEK